jgi:hypothetical protein
MHPEANVTGDRARALADAWRMADNRGGIPHMYEVGQDGEGLVVLGDVLITGSLAWEALGLPQPAESGAYVLHAVMLAAKFALGRWMT